MSDRSRKSAAVPLVVAVVAGIALIAVLIASVTSSGDEPDPRATSDSGTAVHRGTSTPDPWGHLVRRTPDDPVARGDVDAPVVLVAYSDFQCPFCAKFARDTEPTLVEKYVDAGILRIEWRDFPYLGAESVTAARAARAAAAQGEFWAFHEALFTDQLPPNSGRLDEAYTVAIARDLGLDVDRFRADLASDDVRRVASMTNGKPPVTPQCASRGIIGVTS